MRLDRRNFLKAGASALIVRAVTGCADEDSATLYHPRLLEMLGPDKVRDLGAHYRAIVPAEDSMRSLRAAISAGRSELHLPWFHKSIDDAVRDDFAAGRIVLIDGWVLSHTEARQCALFSLAFV